VLKLNTAADKFDIFQTRGTVPMVSLDNDRDISSLCCCKLPGLPMHEVQVVDSCQAINTLDRKVHFDIHSGMSA